MGFIQKLPTQLIAAFRATLEEIAEADVLLHVIDVTHANAQEQSAAVMQTLVDIGAGHIPMIYVLNKVDALTDTVMLDQFKNENPDSIAISAVTGEGLDELLAKVDQLLFETFIPLKVVLPYKEGQLISLFHEMGQVDSIKYAEKGVELKGRLPIRLLARFQAYHKIIFPSID